MYDSKKDKNKDQSLGLHGAAMNGNVGLVKFALDHGAAIDSVVNGYMPLQLACINENHIAVVQYLIDRGADVNAQRWSKKHSADKSQAVVGATGSTALHVACANGCTKIVDLLLRNGAKTNVKDKYGSRPIDVAAAKNHVEIVRLLETFESMQIMLKGLQDGQRKHHVEEVGRRSMDASLLQQQKQTKRSESLRRPSLPSVFDNAKKLEIPDLSTLPPRNSLNSPRPSADEISIITTTSSQQTHYYNGKRYYYSTSPELVSSKSSSDDATSMMEKEDWYSYGVVKNLDEDENYLASLERRAFGIVSPTGTPPSYFSASDIDDKAMIGRASLDSYRRTSFESTPLKRCSSDGGHLRTTALMNAMAANNISLQDDEQATIFDESLEFDESSSPRPSLYGDRPTDLDQLYNNNKKKSWWNSSSSNANRKSMDIYPVGRPSLENNRRSSLDFRPSLDSLSQFAKKSIDGLSRKSIDIDPFIDDKKSPTNNGRGFLSRWWSNSSSNASSNPLRK